MHRVRLPVRGLFDAWRDAARALGAAGVPAADVQWIVGDDSAGLFDGEPSPRNGNAAPAGVPALRVPQAFLDLAGSVLCHRDAEAPALLYAALMRLQEQRGLLGDPADPLVRRLERLAKAVRRDIHKMRAFVRFREVPSEGSRRRFAAWFEPDHRIVERNAGFFTRRYADMDFSIHTPELSMIWQDGLLSFTPGAPRPSLPEDAHEALWATYFANIFNPARIKLDAMRSEMPLKYWKNMPETGQIPAMLAAAEGRVVAMREAGASLPNPRAKPAVIRYREGMPKVPATIASLDDSRAAAALCTRCDLCHHATQTVFGEGDPSARLMIVGEQPGDQEDLQGRPFVGPSGEVLDAAMAEAGVDRAKVWLTNAVKHFKFVPRGKKRLHQNPDAGEIEACKWWLGLEQKFIQPKLTLALGGTAALSLTGKREGIGRRRGRVEETETGPVLLSWHPAYILRIPDSCRAAAARAELTEDLALSMRLLGAA